MLSLRLEPGRASSYSTQRHYVQCLCSTHPGASQPAKAKIPDAEPFGSNIDQAS